MKTDILILGGGLSAVCAAWETVKNSTHRVDLLSWGGGASPYIHGFCLPIGPGDSEELFFRDTMASGYHRNRADLVRRMCWKVSACRPILRNLG